MEWTPTSNEEQPQPERPEAPKLTINDLNLEVEELRATEDLTPGPRRDTGH